MDSRKATYWKHALSGVGTCTPSLRRWRLSRSLTCTPFSSVLVRRKRKIAATVLLSASLAVGNLLMSSTMATWIGGCTMHDQSLAGHSLGSLLYSRDQTVAKLSVNFIRSFHPHAKCFARCFERTLLKRKVTRQGL